jgi:hypothetical protein
VLAACANNEDGARANTQNKAARSNVNLLLDIQLPPGWAPKRALNFPKNGSDKQAAHATEPEIARKWATAQESELRVYLQADYHRLEKILV